MKATNTALSESLTRKWASGTRKPNPEGYGKKIGATFKRRYYAGELTLRELDSDKAKEMRAAVSYENEEKLAARLRERAEKHRGQLNPPGLSARGVGHWKALYWNFRNKDGRVLEGVNLSELIRCNSHMFRPKDVVWKKSYCPATKRLGALIVGGTWCGWSLIEKKFL